MNILFVHQNFPGQFKHLAPALVKEGHRVVALTMQSSKDNSFNGVLLKSYAVKRGSSPNIHPWVADFETKTIRGEACLQAAVDLKEHGFFPDVIVAHPGWGESLFLKSLWPNAKLGIYCEFFYHSHGADVGFDNEFEVTDDLANTCRLKLKNVNNLLNIDMADAGICPTHWQASTFPREFRERITVVHDGIDTQILCPNAQASLSLRTVTGNLILTTADEVVTFVNRNLEPYRGYHVFMRALPSLLKARPHAHILIVGGDDVSYGSRPPKGQKWKDIYAKEVRRQISDEDWKRVHFLGKIPYGVFIGLLQLSRVHVYLTYPFVLSWSLLEAMSCGCAIVASDTQPLHEAIKHKETGMLVNFFDHEALATEIVRLLEQPTERQRLGQNARAFAIEHYDLQTVCLPQQLQWVEQLNG